MSFTSHSRSGFSILGPVNGQLGPGLAEVHALVFVSFYFQQALVVVLSFFKEKGAYGDTIFVLQADVVVPETALLHEEQALVATIRNAGGLLQGIIP